MTRSIEADASLDTRDLQPIERVSVTVADRDYDVRRSDAAAGCEFLDDGIRFVIPGRDRQRGVAATNVQCVELTFRIQPLTFNIPR